jgi:hypothetical protein
VGVTGINNKLINNNKNNPIDNIICIINGIFHGTFRTLTRKMRQYHEELNAVAMVLWMRDKLAFFRAWI